MADMKTLWYEIVAQADRKYNLVLHRSTGLEIIKDFTSYYDASQYGRNEVGNRAFLNAPLTPRNIAPAVEFAGEKEYP